MPQLDTIRSSITSRKWDVSVDVEIIAGDLKILMKNSYMSDFLKMYVRGRSLRWNNRFL